MTINPRDSSADHRTTPMIAQYIEIKSANPDCLLFYRMGDFYELFFHDAEVASQALGIVLTKRGKHQGADIAMCGVPIERSDDYLHRLIRLGHRVAVCEQIEDPAEAKKRGPKSVVKRDVVRIVTPGTLTEDRLLEPRQANILTGLARVRLSDEEWLFGLASADISTGACQLCECSGAELLSTLSRIGPSEIVAPRAMREEGDLWMRLQKIGAPLAVLGRDPGHGAASQQSLLDYFGVATLDGMGAFSRAEMAAAAVLLAYVQATQLDARPSLSLPTRVNRGEFLEIDNATRANLELMRTLGGKREGSLIEVLDHCATAAGSRLLQERLAAPLARSQEITQRLDLVAFFFANEALRAELRVALGAAPDILRALGRLALRRGGPRDLAAIRDGLQVCCALCRLLRAAPDAGAELAGHLEILSGADMGLVAEITAALKSDPPLKARDGDFIAPEFSAQLDEARALRDESRQVIAALQTRYADETGLRQLKIRHNQFLGYYIELPQAQGERLLQPPFASQFTHRQTMADAMRFSTGELAELQSKMASAADRALELEIEIFQRFCDRIGVQLASIKLMAQALAAIDVAAGLAETAAIWGWTRPIVDHSVMFRVEAGRHPVVEAALARSGQSFVANDAQLSDPTGAEHRIAVVTGPNMAGKSTFLRQNALIAVLAQIGSFVPARLAHIGIVDRLFSRVGAADDLARGRSTFMVEMVEAAAILNQATKNSLVILDEIGRGTATFDGLSIAWATIEHLHDISRPRALFATHFHELTQLAVKMTRLVNLAMRVTDWNGELVFLHEVAPGAADRSYGIQVAKLAGLPGSVVERARALLAEFEAQDRSAPVARMIADLPLFAATPRSPPPMAEVDAVGAAIDAVEPDELSPREALQLVYSLKKLREARPTGKAKR